MRAPRTGTTVVAVPRRLDMGLIPDELHRRLRLAAAHADVAMKDYVIAAIERQLDEDERKRAR
jgi:hypothetical protein